MKYTATVALCYAAQLWFAGSLFADPKHGEQIARRWCADCHVVVPNQRRPTSEAPPFSTIANKPDFNAEKLAFFLLSPHPKMPDMGPAPMPPTSPPILRLSNNTARRLI